MRPRPKTLGFTSLLTLLAALYLADAAGAASVARQCREACGDEVAACVGAGGHPRACRRSVLGRCKREGVAACQGEALAPALAGSCSSPTVLPAQGGTFGGATSGTNALAGSCGSSGTAPEQVFQWTPTASGTATIQTCGAGTNFDTVLYMRSDTCASGPEVAAGCNDDACTNATGLFRASRLTPSVTLGHTYFIVVDGYGGAQGTFSLTITPPAPTTTTTTLPGGGGCSSPITIPASGGTVSGATSGASALVGSCGSSGTAPERVYQWTPAVSGTATIQTCGAGTTFDTVLYLRSGACASGPEMAAGCNDDACTNATGLYRASRLTPTVTAGQTYFIVVDGYGGAQGTFSLTVTPPAPTTTTTADPPTTTTTTTRPPTTTTRPPTTTTTTRPPTTTTTTLVGSGGFMSGILTDPTVVLTEPNLPKPTYLVPVVPSLFGVPCTRDGNNVGLSTSPLLGLWGADARHVYSKQEPWSADESLISIENRSSDGPNPLILDGFTYLPKYAPCGNYDLYDYRWHPSRAHPHEQINVNSSGTHLSWFDVVSCTETRSWLLPIAANYGIGSGEGNPSNDGRFVLIQGTQQIYVVDMDPQPPFAPYPSQRIGPALVVSNCGLSDCSIDWAGMSASGKYAVVSYNGDHPRVFDVNTSTLALTPHAMSTTPCDNIGTAAGGFMYSLGHADVAVNPFDSNEDVLVGQDECFPSSGQWNGVLISHVMMARLRDGQITALTDPNNEAFASHISTRNVNRPGWAYVDYYVEDGKRFSAEVIAVKLDGSQAVQRFAHEHSAFSGCYRCEPHASPSPDGRRIIFASNWADHCTTCGSNSDIKDYVIDARAP